MLVTSVVLAKRRTFIALSLKATLSLSSPPTPTTNPSDIARYARDTARLVSLGAKGIVTVTFQHQLLATEPDGAQTFHHILTATYSALCANASAVIATLGFQTRKTVCDQH